MAHLVWWLVLKKVLYIVTYLCVHIVEFGVSSQRGCWPSCFMVDDPLTECEMSKSARRVITELEGIVG